MKTYIILILLIAFSNVLLGQDEHRAELQISVINMPNYSITCTASAVDNTVWNANYEMENNLAPTLLLQE